MQPRIFFYSILIISCLLNLFGCSKKEEIPQIPTPPQQTTSALPPASAPQAPESLPASGGISQLNKVLVIYKDFKKDFFEAISKGHGIDALQARISAADKAYSSCLLFKPDIQDPVAMDFLIKFTDSLRKYSELGHAYLSSLEETDKLLASINENKANLPKVPQNERDKATANLNALITKYNDNYKVTLPKQRDELEALGKELMKLR